MEQPPLERMLTFVLRGAEQTQLVAELMGRMANVILVGPDGTIVTAARRVTHKMTSARVILPGHPYVPPPTPAKAPPDRVTAGELATWLAATPDRQAWRVLVSHVRGVSPLAAREIVFRAVGERARPAGRIDAETVAGVLLALFALPESGDWAPCIARDGDAVVAYAPYRLTHLPGVEVVDSICQAILDYEASQLGGDSYRAARAGVARLIEEARERVRRRLAALAREESEQDAIEHLRLCGDLILAYQTKLAPGQTQLEAPFEPEEPPLLIQVDPARSAVENAQDYYKRYRRARRAAELVPQKIEEAQGAMATLDQLATDLELAEDRAAIDVVHDMLRQSGHIGRPVPRRAPGPDGPLRLVSSDGFTILVGRNSRQNEAVTSRQAKSDALWLHARGVPGGHVVVKSAGGTVPGRTRREAAGLAAYYSRARGEAAVPVVATDVRHVRRLRGGGAGMVTFDHAETLIVAPLPPDEVR